MKRRKTATAVLHITDLPVGILEDAASYLCKPSQALFAVAMSAPSTSWCQYKLVHRPSPATKAIVSSTQWDILDFEDIGDIERRLSDDDIAAILHCINAKQTVKGLKLAWCVNITGRGLNPLQGSVVLEQIDVSLVGKHQWPEHSLQSMMKVDVVLPILDSILAANGCVLKHIQFPRKWLGYYRIVDQEEVRRMNQFQERYNRSLNDRRLSCAGCDRIMIGEQWLAPDLRQKHMCYVCLKPFCRDCENGDNIRCCASSCQKYYCRDCSTVAKCGECVAEFCKGCLGGDMKECEGCEQSACKSCLNNCGCCNRTECLACVAYNMCSADGCSKAHCDECFDANSKEYNVRSCEDCGENYCLDCQLAKCKNEEKECKCCIAAVAPMILKEYKKQEKEIAKLREEIEELRKK